MKSNQGTEKIAKIKAKILAEKDPEIRLALQAFLDLVKQVEKDEANDVR